MIRRENGSYKVSRFSCVTRSGFLERCVIGLANFPSVKQLAIPSLLSTSPYGQWSANRKTEEEDGWRILLSASSWADQTLWRSLFWLDKVGRDTRKLCMFFCFLLMHEWGVWGAETWMTDQTHNSDYCNMTWLCIVGGFENHKPSTIQLH